MAKEPARWVGLGQPCKKVPAQWERQLQGAWKVFERRRGTARCTMSKIWGRRGAQLEGRQRQGRRRKPAQYLDVF